MAISSIHNKSDLKRSYSLSIQKRRDQLASSEEEKDIEVVVDYKLKFNKYIAEKMKSKPDCWYNKTKL